MGLTLNVNNNYQTYILLLLWISGMIKPFVVTYFMDFDIVLFAVFLAFIDIMFRLATKIRTPSKEYITALLLILCLYLYIFISLFYTSSNGYSFEKAINMAPNLIFFIYASTLRKINILRFIQLYCIILIPLALFFIYMKSIVWLVDSEATQIFKGLRNYYLSIGLQLGILFILCHYHFRKIWLMSLVFFLLVASSARAALLFVVLTFFIFEFARIGSIRIKKRFLYIGSVSALVFVGIAMGFKDKIMPLLQNSFARFYVLFKGGGKSTTERLDAMTYAIYESTSDLGTFLFGNGIGSFGILYLGKDGRAYPHNLFLEVLFELGLVGLSVIILLFVLIFKTGYKGNKALFVLFFYCFLNAMKSSSLTDLWILFSIIGLVLNQRKIALN